MPQGTPWTRCTAESRDGTFCDAPSIPEAPFPICIRHAAEIFRFIRRHVAATDEKVSGRGGLENFITLHENMGVLTRTVPSNASRESVVYYVQVGELIKIGHSASLRTRLAAYPPNRRLLATEPGSWSLEAQRHTQFRNLLSCGKEWFTPGPELIDHINGLRRKVRALPINLGDSPTRVA